MLRLTVLLLACLYAIFVIWGAPMPADTEVTRSAPMNSLSDLVATARLDPSVVPATPLEQIPEPAATVKPAAAPVPAITATDVRVVTGDRVNLRVAPSAQSAIVGGVSRGDPAEVVLDDGTSWVRIRTQEGLEAWIFGRFLSEGPT